MSKSFEGVIMLFQLTTYHRQEVAPASYVLLVLPVNLKDKEVLVPYFPSTTWDRRGKSCIETSEGQTGGNRYTRIY